MPNAPESMGEEDPEIALFDAAMRNGGAIDFEPNPTPREMFRINSLLRTGWIVRRGDGRYSVGHAAIRAVMEAREKASLPARREKELEELKNMFTSKITP